VSNRLTQPDRICGAICGHEHEHLRARECALVLLGSYKNELLAMGPNTRTLFEHLHCMGDAEICFGVFQDTRWDATFADLEFGQRN
jgi:hypothetical protein